MEFLKVRGTKLYSENQEIVLHGVSSHGLSFYPEYVNEKTFTFFKDNWKINAFRLAVYTEEENGFCAGDLENCLKLLNLIDKGVSIAVKENLYVIIDWHILSDSNPLTNVDKAIKFFGYVSGHYQNVPNVIYEICNEPNKNCTLADIKNYANQIIPVIRKNSPESLIVVGTTTWSQDVDKMADSPLPYDNLCYSLHFYSSTHTKELRDKADYALSKGLPIFVSEFGISPASGNGPINYEDTKEWLDYLKEKKLSHFAWALANRDETCCFIKPECKKLTDFTLDDYTDCGKHLSDWYAKYQFFLAFI